MHINFKPSQLLILLQILESELQIALQWSYKLILANIKKMIYLQVCSHLKENLIFCGARYSETIVWGVALKKTSSRNTQGIITSKGGSERVYI